MPFIKLHHKSEEVIINTDNVDVIFNDNEERDIYIFMVSIV